MSTSVNLDTGDVSNSGTSNIYTYGSYGFGADSLMCLTKKSTLCQADNTRSEPLLTYDNPHNGSTLGRFFM